MSRPKVKIYGNEYSCAPFRGNTQVCVFRGKAGWSAWLTGTDGRALAPISIRNPRSESAALKAATQAARRIADTPGRPSPARRRRRR